MKETPEIGRTRWYWSEELTCWTWTALTLKLNSIVPLSATGNYQKEDKRSSMSFCLKVDVFVVEIIPKDNNDEKRYKEKTTVLTVKNWWSRLAYYMEL